MEKENFKEQRTSEHLPGKKGNGENKPWHYRISARAVLGAGQCSGLREGGTVPG